MKDSRVWNLLLPYWRSDDRWRGLVLVVVIIAGGFAEVWLSVRLNRWNGTFFNMLTERKPELFRGVMQQFCLLLLGYLVVNGTQSYLNQMLSIRWRRVLTDHMLARWLTNGSFYRIERSRLADNPDQRIAEDVKSFIESTMQMSFGLLTTVVSLVSFSTILWTLSGDVEFVAFGYSMKIPGFMFWLAAIYALLTTVTVHLAGKRMTGLTVSRETAEADFRYGLIQVRENAEQIAFYRGAKVEANRLSDQFEVIQKNWYQIMFYGTRLQLTNAIIAQISGVLPLILLAPRFFAGRITLGAMTQTSGAWGAVAQNLAWFATHYTLIYRWRAVVARLSTLDRAIDALPAEGIRVEFTDGPAIAMDAVSLRLPDETHLRDISSMSVSEGERWLVTGASGAGKSTMLRAIAGLWAYGKGSVYIPRNASLLFLPQKAYLPAGSLKAALAYPGYAASFTDEACREALTACRLEALTRRLDEQARWGQCLSPGEQQRLAFARVLLQRPDFLFMDEATSALDSVNEQHLYKTLIERLPETAIISVAHRTALTAFHSHRMHFDDETSPRAEATVPAQSVGI